MLCALALFAPTGAKAQNSIQGKITNNEGQALPGVTVLIENTYQSVLSDVEGKFSVSGLKNETYTLQAALPGYETAKQTVNLTANLTEVNFMLNATSVTIEEVQVLATRASSKTPTTYTNLGKKQISGSNYGQDLPYLLEATPSTVVTSDAGGGVGYTGIRIRGVDPTRTNVTINGIPVNDAESHGVFWVNMPDFASSVENIQVQRGVGTSSNGAAAFGASINIKTDKLTKNAYGELDNAYGSFNTLRNTVKAGTGLINNRFSVDARLSRISSDGYVDRGASNLKSYYLSGAWIGKKSLLRANVFGGKEVTYQAWYGTPESVINGDVAGMNAYADRNGLTEEQRQNLLTSGRRYNFYTYDNQTDNYQQDHYQLHFTHTFNQKFNLNVSGHYTRGRGYYEEYRAGDDFSTYGFTPVAIGGDTITATDLVRRRWLDNHFYGGVYSLNYDNLKGLKLTLGGGANVYDGTHFGEVIWARYASTSEINDKYYNNTSFKVDMNSYLKATYQIRRATVYGDVQVRNIDYSYLGVDYVSNVLQDQEQRVNYTFFNPKAGFMFDFNEKNNAYVSVSVANREPVRDDFRSSTPDRRPTPETLYNLEAGYRRKSRKFFANANAFVMYYKNQLILTGQINDVGGYTRTNAKESYRAGVELEAGYMILRNLSITGNLTLSQNKVVDFNEYVDDYDNGGQAVINHKNTDIAFSPNAIASAGIAYEPIRGLSLNLLSKYVGKQFLDNTSNEKRKMDAYYLTNLNISYTIKDVVFREIQVGLLVNNVFNYLYENNGYTFSYIAGGQTTTENFYYPQAGRNFLLRLTLKM